MVKSIGKIRRMENKDIEKVTEISIDLLSDSFMSSLGRAFNTLIYKEIIKKGFGFVYVIKERNKENIVGFITGIINKKILITNKLSLLLFLNIIRKPIIITELMSLHLEKNESKPTIFSLAVKKNYQKLGIGKKLNLRLFEEFKKKGIYTIYTKVISNSPSTKFYQKMGFKLINVINRNPSLNEIKIDLKEEEKIKE